MGIRVRPSDRAELREQVAENPGVRLRRLAIHSRHAPERVRRAIHQLREAGEVIVVEDGTDYRVWPTDADVAATGAEPTGYRRADIDEL